MRIVASTEITEREVELLHSVKALEMALRTTLDYIQSELQPNPPANIVGFRDLLVEEGSDGRITLDVMGEFLAVVTSMARFLNDSSSMQVFARNGTTGFVDWVILATVAAQPTGLTDRQLTRFVGASQKRTRRLLGALEDTGMVVLSPNRKPDTVNLRLTPAGEARVTEVATELLPMLTRYVQRNPLQLVFTMRHLHMLFRIHDRAADR